jgi:transaldolase/glucose-6-phosphate isomerase
MALYKHEDAFAASGPGPGPAVRASYALGDYEAPVRSRLVEWIDENTARRIWEKDFTVWSPTEVPEITDRLGWLSLADTMRAEVRDINDFAAEVRSGGIGYVVLLGMGGSSLAPEVYRATFGNRPGYPRLIVLDSTHPDAVRALREEIDRQSTLFIVASKSGTTIEPISLFEYFYHIARAGSDPGSHFTAITDPGTPLEDLAAERGFRKLFRAFPDIGGRYSALSHFGLVPAALIGMDIADYLDRAAETAGRCKTSGAEEANPGLVLGAVLAELALAGRDKVTFVTSPSLAAFPQWLEQLIAESTGKAGKGIVPVAGEPRARPETYGGDRFFAHISLAEETDPEVDAFLETLVGIGHPVARFEVSGRRDLAGEMFRWEMAVAAAGAALGIHPFNQPDVQTAKSLAREVMSEDPGRPAGGVRTMSVEDPQNIASAVRNMLEQAGPGDYFGIHAYIPSSPRTTDVLQEIRSCVHDRYGMATTLGFGPSYLHSTGQLHKGGPNTGVFLQLVDEPDTDIEVPRRGFTFGHLISAQALGDYKALSDGNRRVIRISLGSDVERGLEILLTATGAVAG